MDAERLERAVWRVLERLTLASETLLSSEPDMPSHANTELEHEAATDEARALLDSRTAPEPAQAGDDAGVVEVVDATARAICEAYSCGYSAGCAGSPSSVRSRDLEWLIAKHATTQPAQAGEAVAWGVRRVRTGIIVAAEITKDAAVERASDLTRTLQEEFSTDGHGIPLYGAPSRPGGA